MPRNNLNPGANRSNRKARGAYKRSGYVADKSTMVKGGTLVISAGQLGNPLYTLNRMIQGMHERAEYTGPVRELKDMSAAERLAIEARYGAKIG